MRGEPCQKGWPAGLPVEHRSLQAAMKTPSNSRRFRPSRNGVSGHCGACRPPIHVVSPPPPLAPLNDRVFQQHRIKRPRLNLNATQANSPAPLR
jgi:hypothetical protein